MHRSIGTVAGVLALGALVVGVIESPLFDGLRYGPADITGNVLVGSSILRGSPSDDCQRPSNALRTGPSQHTVLELRVSGRRSRLEIDLDTRRGATEFVTGHNSTLSASLYVIDGSGKWSTTYFSGSQLSADWTGRRGWLDLYLEPDYGVGGPMITDQTYVTWIRITGPWSCA